MKCISTNRIYNNDNSYFECEYIESVGYGDSLCISLNIKDTVNVWMSWGFYLLFINKDGLDFNSFIDYMENIKITGLDLRMGELLIVGVDEL